MEEKKIVYELVNDTWSILKTVVEKDVLQEDEWEELLKTGRELTQKYKRKGNRYYLLFRYFFLGVQEYLTNKNGKA